MPGKKRVAMVVLVTLAGSLCCGAARAQQPDPLGGYPPVLEGARVETYKSVGGTDLKLWIYEPQAGPGSGSRPAVVFFFGGGWRQGNPRQFEPQSRHLAERGIVAVIADYRVLGRHGVPATACVADAKSALRYLRANAARLGIDPERIAAAGGSAGGHLAAATALLPGHDDVADDLSVSARPDALVLFNPAVVLAPVEGFERTPEQWAMLEARLGAALGTISPYHNLRPGAPPTIVFHGREDQLVPYDTVDRFCARMNELEGRCELVGYDGAGHGFFNYGRGGGEAYGDTVSRMDAFLESLGWLEPAVESRQ